MAYKIIYPTVGKRNYPTRKPMPAWAFSGALLSAIFLVITIYNGSANWLLPGDPAVTEAALRKMIENLSQGEAFGDAVTAFCKEIIAGAG
jgi:hypothetical protein